MNLHPSAARKSSLGSRLMRLWLLVAVVAGGGANCRQVVQQYTDPAPRVFAANPTLTDVVGVVNQNSSRVQSLYAPRTRLSGDAFPTLTGDLAFERPRRLRLTGSMLGLGQQLDVGSNDEMFWLWIRHNQPPALYFCRHDQFAFSPARSMMPVRPDWIPEALGLVTFEQGDQHVGPTPVGAGRLQIQTPLDRPDGRTTRVVVIDDARGWVLEDHLYDESGRRIASAVMSDHRRDRLTEVTLPRSVEIQWPAMQLAFRLQIGDEVQINALPPEPGRLWERPSYQGYPDFNLADQALALPQMGQTSSRVAPP